MRPNILLIYTGGTIGMKTDPSTGALIPFDFNDIYDEFPYLKYLDVDIETMVFKPIDSSNVTPQLWERLALIIQKEYDRFDGFVVLHGTDTMAYSASALSFMLENLGKPVIFTGSQIPVGVMRTDGRENLITAIEIASAKDSSGTAMVPEVSLYFQNRLYRANRTTKYSAEELDAFRSVNYPALADVGVSITYHRSAILRPDPSCQLQVKTAMEPHVAVVRLFPGITPEIFSSMMSLPGLKGVVLETYGAGNAPTSSWFIKTVEDTIARGVPVINVTQCSNGSVEMDLYETGKRLQQSGVISGRDITTEAAVTKLMYVLGQEPMGGNRDELLKVSLRGEIHE